MYLEGSMKEYIPLKYALPTPCIENADLNVSLLQLHIPIQPTVSQVLSAISTIMPVSEPTSIH